jgi:hypothetical protein
VAIAEAPAGGPGPSVSTGAVRRGSGAPRPGSSTVAILLRNKTDEASQALDRGEITGRAIVVMD